MSTLPVRAEVAQVEAEPESFWQRPFVQNVLPLITSLAIHLAIVGVGVLTYKAIRAVSDVVSAPPPVLPGEVPDVEQSNRPAMIGQDDPDKPHTQQLRDVPADATGVSTSAELRVNLNPASGGDDALDIAIGASNNAFGPAGKGISARAGIGDEGGGLAPFAPPSKGGGSPVFIVPGNARRVVYLCDSSGSMMTNFDSLRDQLRRAVDALRPIQEFDVVFFAEDSYKALDRQLVRALPETKRNAHDFLDRVTPSGTSDPLPGLRAAFALQPQLVYLLTDGDFPDNAKTLAEIRKLNADKRVKINTIAFVGRGDEYEKLLKQIADENGGIFKFVDEADMRK
ncbi:MAG TPA: VWA domain-containing protein [Tepidisphaeraceae bacterium]|nr:VWA domain-containing protein [Tepidisphaeraceae bacterium]